MQEIIGLTEQYWCPIKHARRVLRTHSRYNRFTDFGNAGSYGQELKKLRSGFDAESDS